MKRSKKNLAWVAVLSTAVGSFFATASIADKPAKQTGFQNIVVDANGKLVGDILGVGLNEATYGGLPFNDVIAVARNFDGQQFVRVEVVKTGFLNAVGANGSTLTQGVILYFPTNNCSGSTIYGYFPWTNEPESPIKRGYVITDPSNNKTVIVYPSGPKTNVAVGSYISIQAGFTPACQPSTGSGTYYPLRQIDVSTLGLASPFSVK